MREWPHPNFRARRWWFWPMILLVIEVMMMLAGLVLLCIAGAWPGRT